MDKWNDGEDKNEFRGMKKERLYIVLIPDPEDKARFTVKVADSTGELETGEQPHMSTLIVSGIMKMLDENLDYLADLGHENLMSNYYESREKLFEDCENIIVFNPKTRH